MAEPEISAETTKTVECVVCEQLIIVPIKLPTSQQLCAEIELDMFDAIASIKFWNKDKSVICPICSAEIVILQLQQFVENER